MTDVTIVQGEFGQAIDIFISDENTGEPLDLSPFVTTKNLDVKPTDYAAAVLANKSLTFKTDGTDGFVVWTIASGDWPATGATAGQYYGQVELVNGATSTRVTKQFDVTIETGVQ